MTISSPIFKMFGRSPIKPLEQHMDKVHACVSQLPEFFKAALQQDWQKAEEHQLCIVSLEKEADCLKRDLRLHLPKGYFLPVARSDLLSLLSSQDKLANVAKDIAGLVLGRQMRFPEQLTQDYTAYLQRAIDASAQAHKAINELDELLETGFKGSEVDVVNDMIVTLGQIESDTDRQQIDIRRKLFAMEEQLPPVDVVFLYKMIDWTGELADRAQNVGDRLQLLLAH